jgi:hypothetical protein
MKREYQQIPRLTDRWVSTGLHIHSIRRYRWGRLDSPVCRRNDYQSTNDATIDESREEGDCSQAGNRARSGAAMRAPLGRFRRRSPQLTRLIFRVQCRWSENELPISSSASVHSFMLTSTLLVTPTLQMPSAPGQVSPVYRIS